MAHIKYEVVYKFPDYTSRRSVEIAISKTGL